MQLPYNRTSSNWTNRPVSSGAYCPWLVDSRSLTLRLRKRYINFEVKQLRNELSKPLVDESAVMQLSLQHKVFIRDVLLMGDSEAVVFAHSVLPLTSLRGSWYDLSNLGNRPLGAALFSNPKVQRTPLHYKKLNKHHILYQKAAQHLDSPPAFLWARRSVFSLNSAKILVTEVFLPSINL